MNSFVQARACARRKVGQKYPALVSVLNVILIREGAQTRWDTTKAILEVDSSLSAQVQSWVVEHELEHYLRDLLRDLTED